MLRYMNVPMLVLTIGLVILRMAMLLLVMLAMTRVRSTALMV